MVVSNVNTASVVVLFIDFVCIMKVFQDNPQPDAHGSTSMHQEYTSRSCRSQKEFWRQISTRHSFLWFQVSISVFETTQFYICFVLILHSSIFIEVPSNYFFTIVKVTYSLYISCVYYMMLCYGRPYPISCGKLISGSAHISYDGSQPSNMRPVRADRMFK